MRKMRLMVAGVLGVVLALGIMGSAQAKKYSEKEYMAFYGTVEKFQKKFDKALNNWNNGNIDNEEFFDELTKMTGESDALANEASNIEPPEDFKRFDYYFTLGIKGLNLTVWYYWVGILDDNQSYLDFAETLYNSATEDMDNAHSLLD